MRHRLLLRGFAACVLACSAFAQTPKPPFTAKDAAEGKRLADLSLDLREQITKGKAPADPFKIMGNLYFVGVANGEVYLLTSPQGHILFGAGFSDTADLVQKNIESLGFKLTDIKAILLNHAHGDQSGAAAEFRKKTGAQVMAGFAEVQFLEHGGVLPGGMPRPANGPPAPPPGPPNRLQKINAQFAGTQQYPPVKVDRALYDGDVINVGPLKVTAHLAPGHSPSPTSWLYNVRDGGKDYRVLEFCCWEYPDDITTNAYITQAGVQHNLELFRKLLPVDIYLETGSYGWSGILNQPSGTMAERMAKLKTGNKYFVNREVFKALSAAREVEIEQKFAALKAAGK
jgi:glyoxylase-like metal-dependent hydrolase (beta-lactamase superfamily II)